MRSDVFQVAKREFLRILGDSRLRTVTLIAPFLYALLFSAVYIRHTVTKLPTAVFVEDNSQPVRTLLRMFNASSKLDITKSVFSINELRAAIFSGAVDTAIVIPRNFTRNLKHGRDSTIPVYVNASSMVAANTSAKAVNEIVQTFSAGVEIKTLMKKGETLRQAKQHFMPVKLDLRPLFNPAFNYSNFMVPGILIAVLQQVILLGVALSWTREKENGTLGELLAMYPSTTAVMIGKSLPYLLINFVVAEIFLRGIFPLNDIPMEGTWYVAISFTFLFIFTIVTWGMWVSGLCSSSLFATQLLMFVAMPSFVLSGFTWPLSAMPSVLQFFAYLLPMTHFATSFRNIYMAGAEFEYVYKNFLMLVLFSIFNIAMTYWVIKRLRKNLSAPL